MATRQIIEIDQDKCNGCGACETGCHEGALRIINGVARLVGENLCDGLGACLGNCPFGAITVVEREAEDYDEAKVMAGKHPAPAAVIPSALSHWPIQLHLVNPRARQFENADLLVAADCTAFALGSFHGELLEGRSLVIACPKLDSGRELYLEKLAVLLASAATVTVAIMEVPCCSGLLKLVLDVRDRLTGHRQVNAVIVGIEGGFVARKTF